MTDVCLDTNRFLKRWVAASTEGCKRIKFRIAGWLLVAAIFKLQTGLRCPLFVSCERNALHRGPECTEMALFCSRGHTATAALPNKTVCACVCVSTCAHVCPVSVSMPGCNCSISGMLVEFCHLNIQQWPLWTSPISLGRSWNALHVLCMGWPSCVPQHSLLLCGDKFGHVGALRSSQKEDTKSLSWTAV